MYKNRIIPRLDVKGLSVVKGVNMEGLRKVGSPVDLAKKYFLQGADELIYMDIVASLYDRSLDYDLVGRVANELYIPLTVGGGIRSLDDINKALRAGADKVAINTYATQNPAFLREAVHLFGAQCIVLSIEAKKYDHKHGWEVYIEGGREHTGRDVEQWTKEVLSYGIGEILLTSVDYEGTKRGYDLPLLQAISSIADVPVVINGGAADAESMRTALQDTSADAVAAATILHYDISTISDLKTTLAMSGIPIRTA